MSATTDRLLALLADGEWHDTPVYTTGFKPAHFRFLHNAGLINLKMDLIRPKVAQAIATDAGLARLRNLPAPPSEAPADLARTLPPTPYRLSESAALSSNGRGHLYVIDANGRRIAALWGKDGEKIALGEMIVKASEAAHG